MASNDLGAHMLGKARFVLNVRVQKHEGTALHESHQAWKPAPRRSDAVSIKIDTVVTAIRVEAERRTLGVGTIVISAERLRQIMREFLLA